MNDVARTALYLGGAAILVGIAALARPSVSTEAIWEDEGEPFYAEFTDPLVAASLEVIDYDEETGSARPFKVEIRDGRWRIPSHYDYPADGEERLAAAAAAVIDLRKDFVRSDRREDHVALGVVDPLDDTTPTLVGRGQRIVLRDARGDELAAFIFGKPIEGRDGYRCVRLPGQKRTYGVRAELDVSTRFADWIDADVLGVEGAELARIVVNDYSIDESSGSVRSEGTIHLARTGTGWSDWSLDELPEGRAIDFAAASAFVGALTDLKIVGVRPKPAGLSADLVATQGLRMDAVTEMSLRSRGYFVAQDGRLLSNEGEVLAGTKDGVLYVLRFGEVLYGSGLEVSAGSEIDDPDDVADAEASPEPGSAENRYLFVTAQFDPALLGEEPTPPSAPRPAEEAPEPADDADGPPAPDADARAAQRAAWSAYDAARATWDARIAEGRAKAERLNARFAPWYYVIPADDFRTLRPDLESLTRESDDR